MISVQVISAGDNYLYLCSQESSQAFLIDPSESRKTLASLDEQKLKLTHILITHHHFDHTGGLRELKSKIGCSVISPDQRRISGADRLVKDGDVIQLGDIETKVIATPGHTTTGICYYLPAQKDNQPIVFTGDTLFIASCGRLLECDADTMWSSLQKLAALPNETLVYCGHDYTEDNLEFALSIEPGNVAVKNRLQQIRELQNQGKPTVPSTILLEKQTNTFLRADTEQIRTALAMLDAPALKVFAELRRRKDKWG
jgi:hydroxyacylglutathione hydrolase